MLIRAFCVWLLIIATETVHGIARMLWLQPLVGDVRARQVAVFSGAALFFAIAVACVRWMRPSSRRQAWQAGLLWLVLTVAFEVGVGRFIAGASWDRIRSDYDLQHGGLLPIGLLILAIAPVAAARIRGLL